jgi:transposase
MNGGWHEHRSEGGGCGIHIRSLVFGRHKRCAVFLVIRKPASSRSTGAQKNELRRCGRIQMGWYDRKVRRVRDLSCGDTRIYLELEVRRVDCRRCGTVKRERLDFLADNPLYTKRFAYLVGRRCRGAIIKDVAEELALDWHTVKAQDKQYMEAQLERAGMPGPQVIGVDAISIRKGHT